MMNILVVCQHYWPEPFNTSDICEELASRGHRVTVLTAMPNAGLPGNEIPNKYRGKKICEEKRRGVRILRVKVHPRKDGAFNRVRNYLSFWRNAGKVAGSLDGDFDVVLGYQFSPVMQVDPGIGYACKHGKKMLLYCFDLWPASLLVGGFKKGSLPYRWMEAVSRRIYSKADRIAVTSPLFDEYFRSELGLSIPDSVYLPQYADDLFSVGSKLAVDSPIVEGFERGKVNFTFAGNVGRAQSVSTIVEAANRLRGEEGICFHVVGSGSCLDQCKRSVEGLELPNIVFHGRKPVEEMPLYYAASDAMLVTFENSPIATYTLPRKVTTYLAAGKPVIAALSGETRRVIEEARCGVCCDAEDAEGLARIAKEFASQSDGDRMGMGRAARDYYEAHFSKQKFYETLERQLEELSRERA